MAEQDDINQTRPGPQSPASWRGLVVALVLAVAFPLGLFAAGRLLSLTTQDALTSVGGNYRQAAADAVVLVVVAAVMWVARLRWGPVMREARPRRSAVVVGLLLALWAVGVGMQILVPLQADSASFVVSLLVLVVLVGAAEELVYRGVLVAGLRRAVPEWAVWLVSSVLFALAHLGTALIGGNPGQLTMTLVLGSACYAARRVTGRLVAAVAVHALYDFGIGLRSHAAAAVSTPLVLGTGLLFIAVAVAGAVLALRGDRQR